MEIPILEDIENVHDLPQFARGKGREKLLFLHETPEEKYVIQEYVKEISEPVLRATVAQQRILHLLMPERFVVDIYDSKIIDEKALIVTNHVEIDESKQPDRAENSKLIAFVKEIKASEEFQELIPDFRKLGLIPENEPEKGQSYTNELAGNTVFDLSGHQIMVDIQSPFIDMDGERVPALRKEGVLEIASREGVGDEVTHLLEEYFNAFEQIDMSDSHIRDY